MYGAATSWRVNATAIVRDFIDSKTQVKLVDASVTNGCDGVLAGLKDVRTTANLIAGSHERDLRR